MRLSFSIPFTLALLTWSAAAAGASLLVNGGFETVDDEGQPQGWATRLPGGGSVDLDEEYSASGRRSLRLRAQRAGRLTAQSAAVPVEPKQWYAVSWRCRTQDVDGGATVSVILDQPRRIDGSLQGGTREWTWHRFFVWTDSGEASLTVRVNLVGIGLAWFDDIEVTQSEGPHGRAPGFDRCTAGLPGGGALRLAWNYPVMKVFAGAPWPQPGDRSITISLARREHEAFQLLLTADRATRVDGLGWEGPAEIGMKWARVAFVNLDPRYAHQASSRPGPNPDPLLPASPFVVPPGSGQVSAILYVDLHASAEAHAGRHSCRLLVRGEQSAIVPVDVEVWPFALPATGALRSWASAEIGLRRYAEGPRGDEIVHQVAELCRTHRVTPMGLATMDLNRMDFVHRDAAGGVQVDFARLDAEVENYHQQGFRGFVVPPRNFRPRGRRADTDVFLGLSIESQEFRRAYTDYCRQMRDHLAQRGWLQEAWWYPWDEPVPDEFDAYERLLRLIRSAAPGARVMTAGFRLPLPRFYGLVDVWTTNLRTAAVNGLMDRIQSRRKAGDDVGAYGNDRYLIEFPLVWQRLWGWTLYRYDFTHTGWYATNMWRGDPWHPSPPADSPRANAFAPGLGVFLYPPPDSALPVCSSLRWEAIRAGVEEYEMLKLVEQRLGRVTARQLAGRLVQGSQPWECDLNMSHLREMRQRVAESLGAPLR